ncbi:molybdenum ABC transporter ATP-binding protein ModC [Vibrio maerlii]|uniref:molybdenum ABC transporter ATP-binding protein ModC n=1 Tax=Vibrio maerlii TaxID=2231648 RepID=UPI000E3C4B32|nr:molybdenum ABC transporter ATP-binding protein ModC [Vibrio maerlii]
MITIKVQKQFGDCGMDFNLTIPSKGITAIFGRSGAGKTSLIKLFSGLHMPDSGVVSIKDRRLFVQEGTRNKPSVNVPIHKRNIGYVFQEPRLFPHYSVKGNLNYGVKQADQSYFERVTKLLGIESLLERQPNALSGGEQQRVAIARALLSKPDILIMDEPLASLDLPRKKEVMPFLEKLTQEVEIPILYVTHSLSEVLRLADHMVLLANGRVAASDTIENIWASKLMRPWQSFSEQSSIFEAVVQQHHEEYALTQVALTANSSLWVQGIDAEQGAKVRVQIRANDVSVTLDAPQRTSIRNILKATISDIEASISHGKKSVSVTLDVGEKKPLFANITPWALDELELTIGQKVYVQIKGVSVTQKDMSLMHDL